MTYYIHNSSVPGYADRRYYFRAETQENARQFMVGQTVSELTKDPNILVITDEMILENLDAPYMRYKQDFQDAAQKRAMTPEPAFVANEDIMQDYESHPILPFDNKEPMDQETFAQGIREMIQRGRDPNSEQQYQETYSDYMSSNPIPPSPKDALNTALKKIVFANSAAFTSLSPDKIDGFQFPDGRVYISQDFIDMNSRLVTFPMPNQGGEPVPVSLVSKDLI